MAPDVSLSVGLTAEDVTTKAKELQSEIESIFKAGDSIQGSAAFEKMLTNLSELYNKSKQVEQSIYDIGSKPTEAMTGLQAELFPIQENLAKAKEEVKEFTAKLVELKATGKRDTLTPEFKAITDKLRSLKAELNGSKLLMQEFSEGMKTGSESAARGYLAEQKNAQRLRTEIAQLTSVKKQMQAAGLDTTFSDEFIEASTALGTARNEVVKLRKEVNRLEAEVKRLKAEGRAYTPLDNNADYKGKLQELENVNNKACNCRSNNQDNQGR